MATNGAPADVIRYRYRGVPAVAPAGLTVMRALEHNGTQLVTGSGCRAGFCGACATVYRMSDGVEVRVALACQTTLQDGMDLTPLQQFPVHRADYDVFTSKDPAKDLNVLYPELATCLGCNTCTRSCPVDLDVMGFVGGLLNGDLPRVAELSFECVSCGLCAARCPVGITPFTAALHARRAVARMAPRSPELRTRLGEIDSGAFTAELSRLGSLSRDDLETAYRTRSIQV